MFRATYVRSVLCLLSSVVLMSGLAHGQANFSDNFEASTLNPFWTVRQQFPLLVFLSPYQNHTPGGMQSVEFSPVFPVFFGAFSPIGGGEGLIGLSHQFAVPQKGDFSIYFYDTAPGAQTQYEQFNLYNSVTTDLASIGTQDFDAFCYEAQLYNYSTQVRQGPNANCGQFPQTSTTNVPRTAGWHKLDILVASSTITLSIDGNAVFSTGGDYSYDFIEIVQFGFRPYTAYSYWDDFAFSSSGCQVSLPNTWPQSGGTWGGDPYDHSYTVTAEDLTTQMRLTDGTASCDITLSKGNLNLDGLASFINTDNKCKASFNAVVRRKLDSPYLDSIYDKRCLTSGCLNGSGTLQLLDTPSDPDSNILTKRTMGGAGCYVTALAMALSYAKVGNVAGSTLDPGLLNQFMGKTLGTLGFNQQGHFYREGDVDGRGTVAAVGQNTTWTALSNYSLDGTNAAYQDLDNSLCSANPYPVIVGVRGISDPKRFPGHYVVVTGKEARPDGSLPAKYLIADPAGLGDSLDYYDKKFETRGIVKNSASQKSLAQGVPNLSALSMNVGDEADLLVVDGNGAMTGFDPDTGSIVQGIPGSVYARDALDDDVNGDQVTGVTHSVDITVPAGGAYWTVITGITTGTYALTINGYATDGSAQSPVSLQGVAEPGSKSTYTLQYSSTPGSPPAVTPMPADRNGDGVVNCADIAIVKASFGKKIGDPGFDPRADANVDGIVNVVDLAIVAKGLPAGTKCP